MIYRSAVIIVNWNSWDDLTLCLDSIFEQSCPFDHILVIDNASRDPANSTLQARMVSHGVNVKILSSNQGFAKANNFAVNSISDCSNFALVNPDAYLDVNWHLRMREAAKRHPEAASFASALIMAKDTSHWDGLGDTYHISGLVRRNAHGKKVSELANQYISVFSPCAAAAYYRLAPFREVGGFDEDYFCYVEDVDLGFRLRLRGYTSILVPEAVAHHVGSACTGGQESDFAVYHGHRNLVWTFVKEMPGALFWLLLPLHLAMNLTSVVWFSLQGRGGVILRAKWDALVGLPAIWRKRTFIQRTRQCSIGEIWRILDKQFFRRR